MGNKQGKRKTLNHHTEQSTVTHAIASIYCLVEGYCKSTYLPNIPFELAQIIAAYYLYTAYLITPNYPITPMLQYNSDSSINIYDDIASSPSFRYTIHYSRIIYQPSKPYQINQKQIQSRKILLVGAKSSGKSTILKQLHYLFHPNHHHKLLSIRPNLIKNLKQSLISLAIHSQDISSYHSQNWKQNSPSLYRADQDIKFLRDRIANMDANSSFDAGLLHDFKLFWHNQATQNTIKWDHELAYIDPSYKYLCANMSNFCKYDYIPTWNDYIHCHIDGMLNESDLLQYMDTIYEFVEHSTYGVNGGWFDPVLDQSPEFDAIIFVANLSGFYRCDYHHDDTNNLMEEIEIFDHIVNRRKLREKEIILLLNVSDIFAHDIVTKGAQITDDSLRDFFGEIKNPQEIIEHLLDMFLNRVNYKDRANIHCFVCNAMDKDMVSNIFQYIHHDLFEMKKRMNTTNLSLNARKSVEVLKLLSRRTL